MNIIEEIQKLSARDIMKYSSIFLASVAPGFLILCHYQPNLVKEYSTAKIIIFSIALTLPLLFANITLIGEYHHSKISQLEAQIMVGALYTFIIYYAPLSIAYLFKLHFKVFAYLLLGLEALFIILFLIPKNKLFGKNSGGE